MSLDHAYLPARGSKAPQIEIDGMGDAGEGGREGREKTGGCHLGSQRIRGQASAPAGGRLAPPPAIKAQERVFAQARDRFRRTSKGHLQGKEGSEHNREDEGVEEIRA